MANVYVVNAAAFLCAFAMGIGIGLSGMGNPHKSFAFFDVFGFGNYGGWDASMLVTFATALVLNVLLFPKVAGMKKPLLVSEFGIPSRTDITTPLVLGSVVFGVGWMLAGFCPGPALLAMSAGSVPATIFSLSMFGGWMWYKHFINDFNTSLSALVSYGLLVAYGLACVMYVPPAAEPVSTLPFDPLTGAIAGLTIGVAVLAFLAINGSILGLSGIFSGIVDPTKSMNDRLSRVCFLSGMLAAGATLHHFAPAYLHNGAPVSPVFSIAGGLCVGAGTAFGSGCTSGHGICGMSRMSPRSIVATAAFFGTAMISLPIISMIRG